MENSSAFNDDLIIYPGICGGCEPIHKFAVDLSTIVKSIYTGDRR